MQSELLNKHGLLHYIAGADYNFRHKTMGDNLQAEIERAVQALNTPVSMVYSGNQVHGKRVAYADGKNGEPFLVGRNFAETDGLMTDQAGLVLLIKYADCTPIIIYDPVRKVQAALHSGWRGTVQKISQVAIRQMQEEFGSQLEDLLVYLGPSIDQANYEVGPEVYEAFAAFPQRDEFMQARGEKYLLSMQGANHAILLMAGLKAEQIELAEASTYLSPRLHSARQEGPSYGLNAILTVIPE